MVGSRYLDPEATPFYGNEALPAGKVPILYLIDD
jgi:hypothetical protein